MSFPRFSPRGDLIAFIDHPAPDDDRGSTAVADLSGKRKTLSKDWASVQGLASSPSGAEVWFTASVSGQSHSLYGVTLSARQRMIAQVPSDVRLEDVTRSGRMLLTRNQRRLGIRGLAPGETKERELSWLEWALLADLSQTGRP